MFDGLSSFKFETADDWLKTRLWRFDQKKLSIKKVKCPIKKLDEYQLNPYFIKIDVQGYELEVLKGGIDTLENFKPILLIESIDRETIKFLDQFQYRFYYYSNGRLLEGKGRLNTFCLTKEKYDELKTSE